MNLTSEILKDLVYNSDLSIGQSVKQLEKAFFEIRNSEKDYALIDIIAVIDDSSKSMHWKLECYILSFLLDYSREEKYLNKLMSHLESNPEIDTNEYNFLYWQLTRTMFVSPKLNTKINQIRMRKIYAQMFSFFNEQIQQENNWIPSDERDQGLVIVMTGQLTSLQHAPTQIALENCYTLIKNYNKKVLLINAANMPRSMCLPYYSPQLWQYINEFINRNILTYQDIEIPFYQFVEEMPSGEEMDSVLKTVMELKPEFILSIGGSNVIADLCSNFVPVVTIPCVVEIPISEGTFLVLPKKITNDDTAVISKLTQSIDKVIESEVAYKPKETEIEFNRSDWGIPEDDHVIVIIGNRLNEEMSEEFIGSLNKLLENNLKARLAIIGDFSISERIAGKYKSFKERTILMGYQKDLSAVFSICDIYLNPPRTGGGTSAADALYRGVPVLTYPFGDVSYVVTDKYHIENLDQVEEYLVNWKQKEFRELEREAALRRADEIFDSSRVLSNLVNEMRKSSAFH
ncbi:glycosyltransferase family 4 protein [Paenibacillus sp. FSL M7-1046]|uniref:glycosyltransferase family 4 protein n=1 Tax=Paenibacillus sp. FSL M7-1046 TaxID=2975315 RepID=UPI0030FBF1AF